MAEDRQAGRFDETDWYLSQIKQKKEKSAERSRAAINLLERYHTIHGWVMRSEIFDSPNGKQGYPYSKPDVYLAALLAETSKSLQEIRLMLDSLVQCKCFAAMKGFSDIV